MQPETKEILPESIAVSIVIPTYDRPDDLHACLSSLMKIKTRRPVEIVVADNNPSSGLTSSVVAQFPAVKLVGERRASVSYARNAGINASSGEIIVMLDDDMTVAADWLEHLVAPFADPTVSAVTGNVLPLQLETESQILFQNYGMGGLTRGDKAWIADKVWFDAHKTRAVRTWLLGCGGNAAARAELFTQTSIGLFEETLGSGSPTGAAEDMYFFYKLLRSGRRIAYTPQSITSHRHRRTMDELRRQLFNYSKGMAAYQAQILFQHMDMRALFELIFWTPAWIGYRLLKRLIGNETFPASLILQEGLGHLEGPCALIASHLRVKQIGRSTQYVPPAHARQHTGVARAPVHEVRR